MDPAPARHLPRPLTTCPQPHRGCREGPPTGRCRCRRTDQNRPGPPTGLIVAKSAGNDHGDCNPNPPNDCDGVTGGDGNEYDLIPQQGIAKNVITVGAVLDSGTTITSFSSNGPSDDGRIKPDIVANGSGLLSAWNTGTNHYDSISGTSMSTPVVSGAIALVVERYRSLYAGADPRPDVVKALLANSATDLGRPGPDYIYGFGLLDAQAALDTLELTTARIVTDSVPAGTADAFLMNVPVGLPELKVTLNWIDPPGVANNALPDLVNDLDLVLVDPAGGLHYPFTGPGTNYAANATATGPNTIDTVEQAVVVAPQSGTWTIRVAGSSVPDGPQLFAVVTNADLVPPSNDDFVDALPVSLPAYAHITANGNSTTEALEDTSPASCSLTTPMSNTVWYRVEPTSDGTITVDTRNSTFDTVLMVWEGNTLAGLTPIVCNDDIDGATRQSEASFAATGGQTYYLQVGGWGGHEGELHFTLSSDINPDDADGDGVLDPRLVVSSHLGGDNVVLRYEWPSGGFVDRLVDGTSVGHPLDGPRGVVVGPDGYLYVSSYDADEVLRFDADTGVFIDTFVLAGDGGLDAPEGLAFDSTGVLHVASYQSDEVLMFNNAGLFLGAAIDAGDGLDAPIGVTVDGNDVVYVASYATNEVYKNDAGVVTTFVAAASGGLNQPHGVLVDATGRLLVASGGTDQILRYTTAGAFDQVFVAAADGGLARPFGLTWGPDGDLYVVGRWSNAVHHYNGQTGAHIATFTQGVTPLDPIFATYTGDNCPNDPNPDPTDTNHNGIGDTCEPTTNPSGWLRATSAPAVPTTISIDGTPANTWGLDWLMLDVGDYEVCFSDVPGFTTPECQQVTVNEAQTSVITGNFAEQGLLNVVTSPAVPAAISVDGSVADGWGVSMRITPGSHEICFGDTPGYVAPAGETVNVIAGQTTTSTGNYTVGASAPPVTGMLRITTSSAVPSLITIDGAPAGEWGIEWVPITPGSREICYTGMPGFSSPLCETVDVVANTTTSVVGSFGALAEVRAQLNPVTNVPVIINGVPRNQYGLWAWYPPAPLEICAPGYSCQTINPTAGSFSDLTLTP